MLWPAMCLSDWVDNVGLLFGPEGIEAGDPSQGEAPAGKTNWYVDANAPDGGDGSYANPYNSFEQVVGWMNGTNYVTGQIRGGDYLYVKGTFSASNHVESSNNMDVHIGRAIQAGTVAEPTVIKSWLGSPRAVFDSEYLKNDIIKLRALSSGGQFIIQNIEVKRANGRGIYVGENVAGCEVISVVIRDGHGDGIVGTGGGILFRLNEGEPHYVMRNSLVYNNDISPEGGTNNRGGISILSEGTVQTGASIDIYDNEIYDEIHPVRHKHSGNVIMNAYHNIIRDSGSAFYVRIYNENNIHHNIIYNTGTAFHLVAENQQGDRRSYIYNNTVYQCSALLSTGPDDAAGWRRIVDLRDNIYYDTITTGTSNPVITLGRWSMDDFDLSDWTSTNNDYYYLAGRTPFLIHQNVFISWENAGAYLSDPVMYDFDPQFVDGPNHDFHLQPTSPAINAASDGADLGALDTGTVLLPPEQAYNPSPPDTDTDVSPSPALSWTGGTRATSHDVYFGTDFNDVNDAVLPAGDVDGNGQVNWDDVMVLGEQWLQNPVGLNPSADLNDDNGVNFIDFAIIGDTWTRDISEVFKGNQTAVTFEPATLDYETTCYWRIDEINAAGITKGNVWSFTTRADTGLDPNLVGYWQLENNANDSAGDNDGTVYGAVATTGKIEQAFSFDEIDDYINIPDFDYTNSSDEFSLSFWFKIDDVAGTAYQYMFSHGNYATSNSLNVYFSETDEGAGGEELRTNITLSDSTSWQPATASIFADGQWHLYTLTVSSTEGATIYIDENPLLTNPAIKGASLNPSTDIYIGGRCDLNTGRYYGNSSIDDGLIDDVRLYNRVLSAVEVALLASSGGS